MAKTLHDLLGRNMALHKGLWLGQTNERPYPQSYNLNISRECEIG